MVASKIESLYKIWIDKVKVEMPQSSDIELLFELAYQIYLAKQSGSSRWTNVSGGQWLAERLSKDGRFNNHQINRLSYMVDDLVNYNQWLLKRNSEQ